MSGVYLSHNVNIVDAKIKGLDTRHGGFLGETATSAHTSRALLGDHFGSGYESDSDESCYSVADEVSAQLQRLRSKQDDMLASLNAWADSVVESASDEALANLAEDGGYVFEPVEEDGNCFFHAVIDQLNQLGLNGDNFDHRSLRAAAVDYILQNYYDYAGFLEDPDAFVEKVLTEGTWADNEIIYAVAMRLGVTIQIIATDEEHGIIINPGQEHTLTLGYHYGLHYGSFRKPPAADLDATAVAEASESRAAPAAAAADLSVHEAPPAGGAGANAGAGAAAPPSSADALVWMTGAFAGISLDPDDKISVNLADPKPAPPPKHGSSHSESKGPQP